MATTMQAALGCTRGLTPSTQTRSTARPRAGPFVPRAVATGSSEGVWLPGVDAPKRLEGLVGNRGFDPFNFAIDPDRLQWCGPRPSSDLGTVIIRVPLVQPVHTVRAKDHWPNLRRETAPPP